MNDLLKQLNDVVAGPETNEDAPESTTMHRLVHDSPDCDWWTESASVLNLSLDDELIVLEFLGIKLGDWGSDEAPNCPQCDKNLYIEQPDGHLVEPKVWFEQVEVDECDSCGQMGAVDDGESSETGSRSYPAVDPPEQHWICRDCVALAESAQEDRMMDAERPMSAREQYLYEK